MGFQRGWRIAASVGAEQTPLDGQGLYRAGGNYCTKNNVRAEGLPIGGRKQGRASSTHTDVGTVKRPSCRH